MASKEGWQTLSVDMGHLSLADQIQELDSADALAGIHGNGQACIWFATRSVVLIDLQPYATSLPGSSPEDHPMFLVSWLRVIADELGILLLVWRAKREHSVPPNSNPSAARTNQFGQTLEDTIVPPEDFLDLIAHARDHLLVAGAKPFNRLRRRSTEDHRQQNNRSALREGTRPDALGPENALEGPLGSSWHRFHETWGCAQKLTLACSLQLGTEGPNSSFCNDVCEVHVDQIAGQWRSEDVILYMQHRVRFFGSNEEEAFSAAQVDGQRMLALEDHELQDMGISKAYKRDIILSAIDAMRGRQRTQPVWEREMHRMWVSKAALQDCVGAMRADGQL
eukprot:CAMPEP_0184289990 /NCGR_PEP_ID=MMETSP1049-20130417/2341_1 /TAXON_ID=77928 /ORGANISM="Proteomonas sulcata, Strain CCMP704" /LENGTH=336 /DNA_ID=CAMNT_0026597001 /DNA_START=27 /DNA_END=1037 /DNA_ORIENTATION=-